ncbi:MAG: hypothetical protein GWP91_24950 [Rhodobacterales bacterium]|nr:hypothetical protein [Rhodobacterales bacterium]
MTPWILAITLAACNSGKIETDSLSLILDGPSRVRVDQLGSVEGPMPSLSDGSAPNDLHIQVRDQTVAQVVNGIVEATGPGETQVIVRWHEQETRWTLVVQPTIHLRFIDAPAMIAPGDQVTIPLQAFIGDERITRGLVEWISSDPAVITVVDGVASAHTSGVAYITAKSDGSQAMVEITVQ